MADLDKSLPGSEESEKLILGAILLDAGLMAQVAHTLTPHDFFGPIHRRVYKAMLDLYYSGSHVDHILVSNEMSKDGSMDSIGGIATIANLTYGIPFFDAETLAHHIKEVKVTAVSRDTIRLCNAVTRDLLDEDIDPQKILSKAENRILQLNSSLVGGNGASESGFTDTGDIVDAVREQFIRYNLGETIGVKTGMKPIDDMLDGGGLQPKAVYLLAGAEKTGKTSLALEWARHIAIEQGKCVPIVTLEMSKETMFKRLYSMQMGIPFFMFRPGFYDSPTDNAYSRAIEGLDTFAQYPFKIADGLFTMSQIERYCTRLVEEGRRNGPEVGLIVLDYLQLIVLDTMKANNREREVSEISRSIKRLASDLNVPILVISSLNRQGMSEGQEPEPYNLRDSQQLAYDAEALMFLHNPAYKPGKPYERKDVTDMTFIMSRQRNGPPGRELFKFIGSYMSFMTEREYNKLVKARGNDPVTKGQAHDEDVNTESLWNEDDDEWETN